MMNRISTLFEQENKNLLSIYFTAGFPQLEDTKKILSSLEKNGADLIEIGMPYSDPLADGPVIQKSSMKALENGMTIQKLFEQLKAYKTESKENQKTVPLVLMGYLNPVLQFGFERFCRETKDCGIDGMIIPDLPIDIYENEYKAVLDQYGLSFIFLVTPQTSEARIRKIDDLSNGFIYAVSSSSVTGGNTNLDLQGAYFNRLKNMGLKNKILIGFGIRDRATFNTAGKYAEGAIIGSAYINAVANSDDVEHSTTVFLNSILNG